MITVLVKIKSIYGVDKIYPANEAAQAIADIACTKTLCPRALYHAIKHLGVKVEALEVDKFALQALLAKGVS